MGLLDQLASSLGELKQDANSAVAALCLADPARLDEIVAGLGSKDARLVGDCAEVMTKVAEQRPDLVAPHARRFFTLLGHKNGRVRWESAHAFAFTAGLVPDLVGEQLEVLRQIIESDGSVIVRDYTVDAVAAYGATSAAAAQRALPVLRLALAVWEGKHAARALAGLAGLLAADPSLASAVREAAEPLVDHERAGVRKAARAALARAVNGSKP